MRHLLSLLAVFICSLNAFSQTTLLKTMIHDGIERSYRVYVPNVYDGSEAVPLILNLHGYTSNAFEQEVYGDFRAIADTANFLLVHPDGTEDNSGTTFWNAFGNPAESVDDIGFLSALIDTVASDFNVDLDRVYSTGMSNGGFMSYTLACQLSQRIAAIASVTGTMVTINLNACNCQHPMPVMQIHGTADPTVPYLGSPQGFVPVEDLVEHWADFNNCNSTPTQTAVPNTNMMDGCTADRFVYAGGDNGSSVELYRVNGGGHTWPGSNPLINIGVTNRDFSASVEIWRFFSQYRLSQLVSVQDLHSVENGIIVFPNPSEGSFSLRLPSNRSAAVQIFDAVGKLVLSETVQSQVVDIDLPTSGAYLLRVQTTNGIFTEKLIRN